MLEGRHFHIHFTNHTPGNKLSTQYRVHERMGGIFLTLTSAAFWGGLLAHLPQFPGVRPIPTPAFPPLWFSLGVLPSATLPLLPKLSSDVMSHEEIAKRWKFPLGSPSF